MRERRAWLCAILLLGPALASAQAFPPAGEAERLSASKEEVVLRPFLVAGAGLALPFGLGGKGENLAGQFKSGPAFHGAAGLSIGGFTIAGLYRRATPGAAKTACTSGDCSATQTQTGVMLLGGPPGLESVGGVIGLGWWKDRAEFKDNASSQKRSLDGWGLFEYASVDFQVGGYRSHVAAGGHLILGIENYTSAKTSAGKVTIGADANQPVFAELGVHLRFL